MSQQRVAAPHPKEGTVSAVASASPSVTMHQQLGRELREAGGQARREMGRQTTSPATASRLADGCQCPVQPHLAQDFLLGRGRSACRGPASARGRQPPPGLSGQGHTAGSGEGLAASGLPPPPRAWPPPASPAPGSSPSPLCCPAQRADPRPSGSSRRGTRRGICQLLQSPPPGPGDPHTGPGLRGHSTSGPPPPSRNAAGGAATSFSRPSLLV